MIARPTFPAFDECSDLRLELGKCILQKEDIFVDEILLENVAIVDALAMTEAAQFIKFAVEFLAYDRLSFVRILGCLREKLRVIALPRSEHATIRNSEDSL